MFTLHFVSNENIIPLGKSVLWSYKCNTRTKRYFGQDEMCVCVQLRVHFAEITPEGLKKIKCFGF